MDLAKEKKWRDLDKEFQALYAQDDVRYLQRQIDQLKRANRLNVPQKVWRIINETSGKGTVYPVTQVKAPHERVLETSGQLIGEWENYF